MTKSVSSLDEGPSRAVPQQQHDLEILLSQGPSSGTQGKGEGSTYRAHGPALLCMGAYLTALKADV